MHPPPAFYGDLLLSALVLELVSVKVVQRARRSMPYPIVSQFTKNFGAVVLRSYSRPVAAQGMTRSVCRGIDFNDLSAGSY
jgi:hypothetical protein